MKKVLPVLLFFACFPFLLFGQSQRPRHEQELERNYQEFKKLFNSEAALQKPDTVEDHRIGNFLHPEQLPNWVFPLSQECKDSLYIIGVSDPGMDEDTGKIIALQRALTMFMLSTDAGVANMREYYGVERDAGVQNRYSEFTGINIRCFLGINQLNIINTHHTQFGETILLVSIPKNRKPCNDQENNTLWQFKAGLYSRATASGNRIQIDEQLNMDVYTDNDTVNAYYSHQYKKINRITNTLTKLSGDTISDMPALNLRYTRQSNTPDPSAADDHILMKQPLHNGLWHAMLTIMLGTVADMAHTGSIHFKQVGDLYQSLMMSLSTELVSTTITLPALEFSIDNNHLYVAPAPINTINE